MTIIGKNPERLIEMYKIDGHKYRLV